MCCLPLGGNQSNNGYGNNMGGGFNQQQSNSTGFSSGMGGGMGNAGPMRNQMNTNRSAPYSVGQGGGQNRGGYSSGGGGGGGGW